MRRCCAKRAFTMAKLNSCFKKTFVFFNVLFAILGVLFLAFGLYIHIASAEQVEGKSTALFVLYGTGLVTFLLSVLGAYGAQKENKCALIAFFVFMCVGTIVLFRISIPLAVSQPEMFSIIREQLKDESLLQVNEYVQHAAEEFQRQAKCCGLFNGYRDWGRQVPPSCTCEPVSGDISQCQEIQVKDQSDSMLVYKQPCGPLVMHYLEKFMTVFLGVLFGLAALAMLGAVMSLSMIIRITATAKTGMPSFTPSYQPPKYSELYSVS